MPVDDVEFMLRLSSLGFTIVGVTHPGFTVYWREHSMSRGGVGPTRSALTLCDVIRPFAPSGSSGANTILTPGEYQAFLKKALCAAAQSLVAGGRLKEAQELFREARFLQGGSLQMRLGVTLGALMPRLVGWFSSRFWFSLRRTLFRRQLAKRLSQTR